MWTRLRVVNGVLEGISHKVKLVSHRAHGLRKVDTYSASQVGGIA